MTRRSKRFELILGASLLFSAISGCKSHADGDPETDVKAIVPVRAAVVTMGPVEDVLSVTGKTEAIRKEKVFAPIAGRIITLTALEGSSVHEGDVIASIQTKDAQAAIEGARVLLAQASIPAEKAHAQEVLHQAEATANGVSVRASMSGLVSVRSANPGEYVEEGQELFTLVDPASVNFVADVPLRSMSKVNVGAQARVWIPGMLDQKLSAAVVSVKPQALLESQTAQVVLRFDQVAERHIQLLRTDIVGTADIVVASRKNVLLVPKNALLRNDETNTFQIVTFGADSLAKNIDVQRGGSRGDLIEVIGNVKQGMNVVTEGNYSLADSTRITLQH
jgi:multidrug efflux pump subunit AcrA (membrane-fusion protein)